MYAAMLTPRLAAEMKQLDLEGSFHLRPFKHL